MGTGESMSWRKAGSVLHRRFTHNFPNVQHRFHRNWRRILCRIPTACHQRKIENIRQGLLRTCEPEGCGKDEAIYLSSLLHPSSRCDFLQPELRRGPAMWEHCRTDNIIVPAAWTLPTYFTIKWASLWAQGVIWLRGAAICEIDSQMQPLFTLKTHQLELYYFPFKLQT